jgi:hypothetical protein
MATYSSNKNCRSKSHSSTVGNWMGNEPYTIPKRELKFNVDYLKWTQLINLRFSETITQYDNKNVIKHGSINPWTENIRNQNVLRNK